MAHHGGGGWGLCCASKNEKKRNIPMSKFYGAIVFDSRRNTNRD